MFGHRYFGARYFGPVYFGPAVGQSVVVVTVAAGRPFRKRRKPEYAAVEALAHDLLGPAEDSGIRPWARSERDLEAFLLLEHL